MTNRLAVIAVVLALAAIVGVMAYNAGTANGIAISGKMPAPSAAAPYAYPYPYFGWHPWHGGFFFFPFLFIAFWFFAARMLFWRRGAYGRGCGGGYEERFDEWHRRSHERMKDA